MLMSAAPKSSHEPQGTVLADGGEDYLLGHVAMIPPPNAAVAAFKALTILNLTELARASCRTASGALPLRAACPLFAWRKGLRHSAKPFPRSARRPAVAAVE